MQNDGQPIFKIKKFKNIVNKKRSYLRQAYDSYMIKNLILYSEILKKLYFHEPKIM